MRMTETSILIDLSAAEVFRYATDPAHLSEWVVPEDQTIMSSEKAFGECFSDRINAAGDSPRRGFIDTVIGFDPPNSFTVKPPGRLLTYTDNIFQEEGEETRVIDRIEMENPPGILNLMGGFLLRRVAEVQNHRLERLQATLEGRGK